MPKTLKYQLITILDRRLESIKSFDTYEEAYHVMEQDLTSIMDMDITQLKEHEEFGDGFFIEGCSAWLCEPYTWNLNWQIIPVDA